MHHFGNVGRRRHAGVYLSLLITGLLLSTTPFVGEDQGIPDPSEPRRITGCLRRHHYLNAYDLHNGKDRIKVVGPRFLMQDVGKLVIVTGTWRNYGSFANSKSDGDPFFAVTEVEVVADRCPVSPPDASPRPKDSSAVPDSR